MAVVPSCAALPFAWSGCSGTPNPTHPPYPPAALGGFFVTSLVFPSSSPFHSASSLGSCLCRLVGRRNAPPGNSCGMPVLVVVPSLVVPAQPFSSSAPQFACGKVHRLSQQEPPDGGAPLTGRSAVGISTAQAPPAPLKGGASYQL